MFHRRGGRATGMIDTPDEESARRSSAKNEERSVALTSDR
jgi:hypothetical protein